MNSRTGNCFPFFPESANGFFRISTGTVFSGKKNWIILLRRTRHEPVGFIPEP
jgi:hypothetical protein